MAGSAAATKHLIAYTDGGCRGNPGPGGWAFLLIDPKSRTALERADAVAEDTTNNRMEMTAAIKALSALTRPSRVVIYTDSKYLLGCPEWMPGWKAKGWKKKRGPLLNVDLLQQLDEELARHRAEFRWVAGHAGEPGNEHVDQLVNEALDRLELGQTIQWERRFRWTRPLPDHL